MKKHMMSLLALSVILAFTSGCKTTESVEQTADHYHRDSTTYSPWGGRISNEGDNSRHIAVPVYRDYDAAQDQQPPAAVNTVVPDASRVCPDCNIPVGKSHWTRSNSSASGKKYLMAWEVSDARQITPGQGVVRYTGNWFGGLGARLSAGFRYSDDSYGNDGCGRFGSDWGYNYQGRQSAQWRDNNCNENVGRSANNNNSGCFGGGSYNGGGHSGGNGNHHNR